MTEPGAVIPVDPADHDAFCQLFGRFGPHAAKVQDGSQDSDWRLQVLARHRVAPAALGEILGRALTIKATYIDTGAIEINPASHEDAKALFDIVALAGEGRE